MYGDGGACFVDTGTAVVAGGGGTVDELPVTVDTGISVVIGGIVEVVFVVAGAFVGTVLFGGKEVVDEAESVVMLLGTGVLDVVSMVGGGGELSVIFPAAGTVVLSLVLLIVAAALEASVLG